MTELERYKRATAVLTEALKQYTHPDSTSVCDVLTMVDDILSPPLEFDTVESVMWQILEPNGARRGCYPDFKPSLSPAELAKGWIVVEHKGNYLRAKPIPVERSARLLFEAAPSSIYQRISGDNLPMSEFEATITWQAKGDNP